MTVKEEMISNNKSKKKTLERIFLINHSASLSLSLVLSPYVICFWFIGCLSNRFNLAGWGNHSLSTDLIQLKDDSTKAK